MVYFWARLACRDLLDRHPYARTLAFAVGLLATLAIFWQIVWAAPAA